MRRCAPLLAMLAACAPKPTATATAPLPVVPLLQDAGAPAARAPIAVGETCTRLPCPVTRTTVDITPYGAVSAAVSGDEVWFLHRTYGKDGKIALLTRGPSDTDDRVLAEDLVGRTDLTTHQMLVDDGTLYLGTGSGLLAWNKTVALLTPDWDVRRIALDASHVYLTVQDCRVYRVPRKGGAPELLSAPPAPPKDPDSFCDRPSLAVDDTNVWFTAENTDHVFTIAKAPGKAKRRSIQLPGREHFVSGLTHDADNLYALEGESTRTALLRIPKKGGNPASIQTIVAMSHGPASDADHVYVFDVDADQIVLVAVPKAGGPRRVLARFENDDEPMAILPGATSVVVGYFHHSMVPEENQAYLQRIAK